MHSLHRLFYFSYGLIVLTSKLRYIFNIKNKGLRNDEQFKKTLFYRDHDHVHFDD